MGTAKILVAGVDGGFGGALASLLIARGYAVTGTVSRISKVDPVRASHPGLADVFALDLADIEHIQSKLTGLLPDPLAGVFVCAAASPICPAELTTPELFRRTMDINCLSNLEIYKACIGALRQSRGRLVLTSSVTGEVPMPLQAAYGASKFALEGLADVLRLEASAWGVPVILLQPGGIDTPMQDRCFEWISEGIAALDEADRARYERPYRQFARVIANARAAGSSATPAFVAQAALAAFEATDPPTRVPIGADSEFLTRAVRTMTDREVDAIMLDAINAA